MKQVFIAIVLSLFLAACSDEGAVSYDVEGFNSVTPEPASADDSGSSGATPGTASSNCRSKAYYDYYDCGVGSLPDKGDDNISKPIVHTSPVELNLVSGKFCSFASTTSDTSYFTQSSGPGTSDTRTYAQGGNNYGQINNTPSSDPMGLTLMSM